MENKITYNLSTMFKNLEKDDDHIMNLGFLRALSLVRSVEKKMLKEAKLNITPRELNYLALIKFNPDWKQTDLLEMLDISKGSFSTIMKLLVLKGFIKKEIDANDKRVKRFVFTAKGEKALEVNSKIRKTIKQYLKTKLTDEEIRKFIELAIRMDI